MKRYIISLIIFLSIVPSLGQQEIGRLTVDRYLSWEDVENAQLSPDGHPMVRALPFLPLINQVEPKSSSAGWTLRVQ